MHAQRKAIYPGTFDPITNGHIDIVKRATLLFDQVIVAVTTNPAKSPLFTVSERLEMIRASLEGISNVVVDSFEGLLVDYARRVGAVAVIRGLRAVTDFEMEFQMALVNRKLYPELVTVFLMPNEKYTYLNSTIVKEVARFGGNVSCFVPEVVERKLKERFGWL
ncbi:MAG: pantetheine-phosphate adenylyltransferase [candidate division KSB1 bacterium]|nr:pantetheine-phosphate adenylyltransferase [candidate division KSB1 bacterium]